MAFTSAHHLFAPPRVLKWRLVMGLGEFVALFILIFLYSMK